MKIGIDIGGTSINCGLVNQEGQIVKQVKVKTPVNTQIKLENTLISTIEKLTESLNLIESIGIGIPGILDKKNGTVVLAANLNLKNYEITDLFSQHPKLKNIPLSFDGDGQCAALAEHFYGAAKNTKNSVTITLGTGFGGGVIIDNKPLQKIPEIGHHIVNAAGFQCACGRTGCLESYVSVTGIKNLTNEKNNESLIYDFFHKKFYQPNRDTFYHYLAVGLSNITYLYWPDTIVIGGGLSHHITPDLDTITHLYHEMLITPSDRANITLAHFRNEAGIIGATLINR